MPALERYPRNHGCPRRFYGRRARLGANAALGYRPLEHQAVLTPRNFEPNRFIATVAVIALQLMAQLADLHPHDGVATGIEIGGILLEYFDAERALIQTLRVSNQGLPYQ